MFFFRWVKLMTRLTDAKIHLYEKKEEMEVLLDDKKLRGPG
jgi:hypothetical protein